MSRTSAVAILVGVGLVSGATWSPGDEAPSPDPLLPFSTPLGGSHGEADSAMALGPDGALWIAVSSFSRDFPGAERPGLPDGKEGIVVLRFDPATKAVLSSVWLGAGGTPEAVAFDASGNAFVVGTTSSFDFPVTAGIPAPAPVTRVLRDGRVIRMVDESAFLVKVDSAGTGVLWSALLGGGSQDVGSAVAVTAEGDPVVVGRTSSGDFPLQGPLQATLAGDADIWVSRVLADGSGFAFSTYLGGAGFDDGESVCLLPNGNLLLAGETKSKGFPSTDTLVGTTSTKYTGFLAEMDPRGTQVQRGTRMEDSIPWGTLVESTGSLLLYGTTRDAGFPAIHAPHGPPGDADGCGDVFLMRLDGGDWSILATALYGGVAHERPVAAALAPDGTVWIGGDSRGTDLPMAGAARPLRSGYIDAFAAAFNASDLSLRTATCLGGRDAELGSAMAVDADGGAWFSGTTSSPDFPLVAPLPSLGNFDLFLCRLLPGDPAARPAAPGGLAAEEQEDGSVLLTFEDRSSDENGFAVYRRDVDPLSGYEAGDIGYTRVAVLPADATEWVDGDIVSGHSCSWAVQAFNDAGGSDATAPVSIDLPESFKVLVTEGALRGSSGRGEVRIRGIVSAIRALPGGNPDPARDGFASRMGRGDPAPAAARAAVEAGDPGWKGRGRRLRWSGRDLRLSYDRETGAFELRMRTDGGLVPPGESIPLEIRVGRRAGVAAPTWSTAGRNRLRVR